MALLLKDIYNQTKQIYKLDIIAGQNGLEHIMNWVYVSEDLNNADFIQGGELVITTGVSAHFTENWLYLFVKAMIEHNTSGMIINTGKYISERDISQDIIDMCNDNAYPLFIMPWNIHIYDVTRDYCNRIFSENKTFETVENALISVIRQDEDCIKSISILESNGILQEGVYRICVIDGAEIDSVSLSLRFILDNIIMHSSVYVKVICVKRQLVLVFNMMSTSNYNNTFTIYNCNNMNTAYGGSNMVAASNYGNTSVIHLIANKIKQAVERYLRTDKLILGIGGGVLSLHKLKDSYEQALAAVKLAQYNGADVYNYDDGGIYKVLFAVQDKAVIQQYINDELGNIHNYDREHNSNMSDTLRSYLWQKGSIQKVADELFCHRNTINNRMRIIKDDIITNIDDPVVSNRIMLAYMMEDYLNMLK